MAKRRKQPQTDLESVRVQLGPLFGYPARTWLPALLGLFAAVILLYLLVLPGVLNAGAQVDLRSTPSGAAVYVDNVRIGATPLQTRLAAGTREIQFRRPHFVPLELQVEVPNRLIGSRFFPARLELHRTLQLDDPRAVANVVAEEFAGWSIIGSASAQYQFPWVLSGGITDLAADPEALDSHGGPLLEAALADVRSDALLRDYLRGTALRFSAGNAVLPAHMLDLFVLLVDSVGSRPNLALLFSAALSEELRQALDASPWYRDALEQQSTRLLPFTTEGGPSVHSAGSVTVAGAAFRHLSGGRFVMGMPANGAAGSSGDSLDRPHVVEVAEFYIQQTPVTRAEYRTFLAQNPYWRDDNRERLVEDGVASGDYLDSWGFTSDNSDGMLPATEVSFHAAAAYSDWLTTRLPATLSGWVARLPYEEEYEWAVLANASDGYEAGFRRTADQSAPYPVAQFPSGQFAIYDLLGNVWHWTANWYRPADYLVRNHLHSPYDAPDGPHAAERAVRGGSWANSAGSVNGITRGSQPPLWSSPFLGFRPVISQVQ